MRKNITLLALPAMIAALSGCATVNNLLGSGEAQASQPTTSRVAPLVVPPDYALRPTNVMPTRANDGRAEQVLDALFGGPAPRSVSEASVTALAGNAEPGIRSTVGDPETLTVNKGSVTRDIIAAPEGDGQNAQAVIPQS